MRRFLPICLELKMQSPIRVNSKRFKIARKCHLNLQKIGLLQTAVFGTNLN